MPKMSLVTSLIFNSYSIMILLILFRYSIKKYRSMPIDHQIYLLLIKATVFILIIDFLSRFDGNPNTIYSPINTYGNFLLFSMNPVLPSLWFIYVYQKIFLHQKKMKKIANFLIVAFSLNLLMVIVNQYYGFLYYIDVNNIYHRGSMYVLSVAYTLFLLVVSYVMLIFNRKKIEEKYFFALIFFGLPPLIGTLLQTYFYGIPFALNSVVFSLLIVFLYIQNDDIHTDHLTGIANRKRLEDVLNDRVNYSNKSKSFSLIVIDLDDFKKINDTYGHEMGDNALKAVTQNLTSALRSSDFISRFGGDEFCIITDISKGENLQLAINRINNCAESINNSKELPFNISFSMGYAIYDTSLNMTAQDFLKYVDLLMYENKKRKK
jgi:diguanylate cyclase (GGDEF)-like protein